MITPQDESASVLLGHPDAVRRAALRVELESIGHRVVGEASTAAQLADMATDVQVEVIITVSHFGDATGPSALIAAAETEPLPGIVITSEPERALIEEALRDHVMAFVVEPVTGAELKPLIHLVRERFAEFQDLRSQVADLEAALEARKLIERAKGVLMADRGIDERSAHRALQRMANDQRAKLVEAARSVLDAHADPGGSPDLEAAGGLDAQADPDAQPGGASPV